jgi:hypothetical protein
VLRPAFEPQELADRLPADYAYVGEVYSDPTAREHPEKVFDGDRGVQRWGVRGEGDETLAWAGRYSFEEGRTFRGRDEGDEKDRLGREGLAACLPQGRVRA